jgi:hypothetical protein
MTITPMMQKSMTNDIDLANEAASGRCDAAGASYYALYQTVNARDLKRLPRLIVDIIEHQSWRKWRWIGSNFDAPSLDAYLNLPPPKGIGIGVDLFRRLIADNNRALEAFDKARQRPPSLHIDREGGDGDGDGDAVDNIHGTERPTGTSVEATIRRLRKHHPELHARWLAGELSANAAAIEAGFRRGPGTAFERVMKLWPKLTEDERQQIRDIA